MERRHPWRRWRRRRRRTDPGLQAYTAKKSPRCCGRQQRGVDAVAVAVVAVAVVVVAVVAAYYPPGRLTIFSHDFDVGLKWLRRPLTRSFVRTSSGLSSTADERRRRRRGSKERRRTKCVCVCVVLKVRI